MRIVEVVSYSCKYCGKEFKNGGGKATHEPYCSLNPNKVVRARSPLSGTTKGVAPWNKGLSKATDPRVANNAAAVSAATKGKPSKTIWTDDMRKAKSEWRKQLHKDNPETHPNRRLAGNRNKMTYPEKVAFEYLTKLGIEFEHQKQIGKYFPDFVVGNVIIEIDGAQWHNAEKDQARDAVLNSLGYTVYRIDSKDRIEQRIADILGV